MSKRKMKIDDFDIFSDGKEKIAGPLVSYYEEAKAASEAGELKVVSEKICEPYAGHGFKLKRGQVMRWELIDGPMAIDTFYYAAKRPEKEFAATFGTTVFSGMQLFEGASLWTNNPYLRPLMTLIRDSVDNEKIKEMLGHEASSHSWLVPNGRCNQGIWEAYWGIPNCNSCDYNHVEGIFKAMGPELGERVARLQVEPQSFVHFTAMAFDRLPMNFTAYAGEGGMFKRGDFVELLAHDDTYAIVSLCPNGDFKTTKTAFQDFTSWPVKAQILERPGNPLRTMDDPERKSMFSVDFYLAGAPRMVKGRIGNKDSETYFGDPEEK